MHQLFTYTITYIFIFRFLSVWLWNSLVGPVILTKCCVLHNAFVDVDMYVSHLLPISQTEHYILLFSEIYALKQATKLVLSILCADIQIYYILGCGQNCLFLFLRIQNDLEDVIRRGEGTQDCCYLLWQNGLACQPVEDHHVIVDYTQFFFIVLCSFERGKNDGRKWQFANKKKLLMRPYTAILPVLTYGSMHCEANRLGVCWYEQKGGLETSLSVWWRVWHKLNGSINYRLRKLKACFDIHALRGRSLSPSSSHPIADDNVEPAGRAIVAKKWRKDYRLLFVKWCFYLKTAIVRFCFTDF